MFKKSGSRVAVVLDEYGTVEGLLTLTDILEAIVGDMPDGDEDEVPPAVQRSDGSWLLDGRLPLDEFRDLFELPSIPEANSISAGLVVTQLGHIPSVGESFDSWGLGFEVVDMDGNRVDRILVKPLADASKPPPEPEGENRRCLLVAGAGRRPLHFQQVDTLLNQEKRDDSLPPPGVHSWRRSQWRSRGRRFGDARIGARLCGQRHPQRRLPGHGRRCQTLMKSLAQVPGVRIAAVCDVYDAHLNGRRRLADPKAIATKHYRELLDRKDIDAVLIGSPDHWHVPMAIDACNAGKDVYVEKPLTHDLAEGAAIIDAQNRNTKIVQVGMQQRSMPHIQKARDWSRAGGSARSSRST